MMTGGEILELISCESCFAEWCESCPERREIPSPKEDGLAVEPVDYTCPCEFDVESKGCVKRDILERSAPQPTLLRKSLRGGRYDD